MRILTAALTAISLWAVFAPALSASAEERRYCTQTGPFLLRFETAHAAGFFKALPKNGGGPGAVAGAMPGRTLTGDWMTPDARGALRMGFSEDWSSFVAAYAPEADPENWRTGWMGYLPPAGDPPTFVIDGETFHCD